MVEKSTKPISPQPKPGSTPPTTTPGAKPDAKPGDKPTNPTPGKADPKTTEPTPNRNSIPKSNIQGPSPLQKQHRDIRGQPDYIPASITFLTGDFRGKVIDLGLAMNEISHSESAEWESQESDWIRPGLNFKKLSNRDISITLTFFDLNIDISHLVENIKHLKEVGSEEKTPPRLLFVQGDLRAVECVCTDVQDKYSDPLPFSKQKGKNGFRKCEVSITLRMAGGLNNSNALGGPLTSTPLLDYKNSTTAAERQRIGRQAVIQELLAPCLGAVGSAALQGLLDARQQDNPTAISALDPNTFVQAAIAGVFSVETLKSDRLRAKLQHDLALVMAQNEGGVSNTPAVRNFANALASANPSGLSKALQDQYGSVKPDYDKIMDAIQDQKLDTSAEIYDRNKNASAASRLYDSGNCGLDMRRMGAYALSPVQAEDAKTLKLLNEFFAGKPSDDDIKTRFGLETEEQVRTLKNGQPYQTKEEFLSRASSRTAGLTGYKLWSTFAENTDE